MHSSSVRLCFVRVFGAIAAGSLVAGFSFSAVFAQGGPPKKGTPAQEQTQAREAWRATMARKPVPKQGCFKAEYPKTEWQEVPCVAAPKRPFLPPGSAPPVIVGGGGVSDFSARVTGLISSATGSFENIAGVVSETGGGTANSYSLQINTRPFTAAACAGGNAACLGWQQFIYSTSGFAFMQYWLVDYGPGCPAGWMAYAPHCYRNSANAVGVPTNIAITNLNQLSLTGTAAAGGMDTVSFANGGSVYAIAANDNVLSLAGSWRDAEFNIFGDGNGSQAVFNAGSRMAVRIGATDGTMNAPACIAASYTGETNSLSLVPPCCPYGGAIAGGRILAEQQSGCDFDVFRRHQYR